MTDLKAKALNRRHTVLVTQHFLRCGRGSAAISFAQLRQLVGSRQYVANKDTLVIRWIIFSMRCWR